MNSEDGQKPHIEKALDCHNRLYGTDFRVTGRCEQLYPELHEKRRWDWVCRTSAGKEGAVEAKRLTDERKQKGYALLEKTAHGLQTNPPDGLRGTYQLLLDVDDSFLVRLADEETPSVRELTNAIRNAIGQITPTLRGQESRDLRDELETQLWPPALVGLHVELKRLTEDGSRVLVDIQPGGSGPVGKLMGDDLQKYEALVRTANSQLNQAKTMGIPETFLVTLDLLYQLAASPDTIKNTFRTLSPELHCNIDYVYHVASSVTPVKP